MKQKIFLIIVSLLLAIFILVSYYTLFYLPQKKQKEIAQVKQKIQELKKETEEIKKFDVEEFSERAAKQFSFDDYFSTSTDIEVEGVEIIPQENSKLVINHEEGYQIEIPKDFILNQTDNTDALHFDSPIRIQMGLSSGRWTVIYIFYFDKNKKPDLYNMLVEFAEKATEKTEIVINGKKFIKTIERREGDNLIVGYDYYYIENNKALNISVERTAKYTPDDLENFVKTFRFINK